jgi:tetratricopeptide (TPR) repeat protein
MIKIRGGVGVGWGVVACVVAVSLHGSLTAQPEEAQSAEVPQEVEQPAIEAEAPLISGNVVDARGGGIADAWLTFVVVEDPTVEAAASLDDSGGFRIGTLPAAGADARWTIGDVGAYGYLLVSVSVELLDGNGKLTGDAQTVDFTPGVSMPEFRVPAEGAVRVRLVMGGKAEVAARWAEARRKEREARPQVEQPQEGAISGDASALWAAGNDKFAAKDYAGAVADYDAALEAAPDEPRLLAAKASALFYLGNYVEARQAAEAALGAGSGDIQLLLALTDRFNKAGDAQNAEGILDTLESAAPENPDVHVQRARLSKQQGKTAAAVAAYAEATRLSPDNLKLWTEMATYCRENGETDCARKAYGALVARNPEYDKTAYYFLGSLSEGEESIGHYEKAAQYVPEAYIKLCVAYNEAGETQKAIAACSRYLELKPDGPQAEQVQALLHSFGQQPAPAPPADQ